MDFGRRGRRRRGRRGCRRCGRASRTWANRPGQVTTSLPIPPLHLLKRLIHLLSWFLATPVSSSTCLSSPYTRSSLTYHPRPCFSAASSPAISTQPSTTKRSGGGPLNATSSKAGAGLLLEGACLEEVAGAGGRRHWVESDSSSSYFRLCRIITRAWLTAIVLYSPLSVECLGLRRLPSPTTLASPL